MVVPLVHAIRYQDSADIFSCFSHLPNVVFLDSADQREGCGDYSYIAIDPFAVLSSKNGEIVFDGVTQKGNPFDFLRKKLKDFFCKSLPGLPPFQGGVAGYFAYDLYQHLEDLPLHQVDDMQFPDMVLGFYDLVMAWDHRQKKAWIFSSGFPCADNAARAARAKARMTWLLSFFWDKSQVLLGQNTAVRSDAIMADMGSQQYESSVRQVIDYILAGDIFEANISQRFQMDVPDGFCLPTLYARLRKLNPAPFAAYLQFDAVTLISASPERFLRVENNDVESRPIKGTRPRGLTESEDLRYAEELRYSEKDHAENVMIVDLLRNDLSKVCQNHTVKVPQLCGLESYATVHHLVSVITGRLKPGCDALDLFQASFPGGSITGAPKIRAMQIIAEIEPTARGPYCGSVGYIGFNGNMDSSIVIRTFAVKNHRLTFQSGGAVVADSQPAEEYAETFVKAHALYRVLTEG